MALATTFAALAAPPVGGAKRRARPAMTAAPRVASRRAAIGLASRFGGDVRALAPRVAPGGRSRAGLQVTAMGGRVDPKDTWWEKNTADNMRDVHGTDELLAALADAGERLVVVDFYARWCGACRALYPKLCKIAAANPEVVFLKVEFDDNRDMCRSMGVKVLPYFHLYRGAEGKVASFSASISKVGRLREAIEEYAQGSTGGPSRDASRDESRDEVPMSR